MPTILIINATGNVQGFENKLASDLYSAISSKSGWTVSAISVNDFRAFVEIDTSDADAVLLIAHGDRGTSKSVAGIDVGTDDVHWYLAGSLNVQEKAILLCVCDGFNRDTVAGILREQMPTFIIGSKDGRGLSAFQALEFFTDLMALAATPNQLGDAANRAASETGVPMSVWVGLSA